MDIHDITTHWSQITGVLGAASTLAAATYKFLPRRGTTLEPRQVHGANASNMVVIVNVSNHPDGSTTPAKKTGKTPTKPKKRGPRKA